MTMEKVKLTKSQKILFAVLGVVLAFAAFDFLSNKDTYMSFYAKENREATATAQQTEEKNKSEKDQLQASLISSWGSDPFLRQQVVVAKRRSRKKVKRPTFKLKAISYRAEGSVALINDRVVKVGDVLSGYKVLKIDSRQVVLWNGKNRIVLRLTNM